MSEHLKPSNSSNESIQQIIDEVKASIDGLVASQAAVYAVSASMRETVALSTDSLVSTNDDPSRITIASPDRITITADDLKEPPAAVPETANSLDPSTPEERLAKLYELVPEQSADVSGEDYPDIEVGDPFDSIDSMMSFVKNWAKNYKQGHEFINSLRSDEDFNAFVDEIKAKAKEEAAGDHDILLESLDQIDREIDDIFMSLVDEPTDAEIVALANTATDEELKTLQVRQTAGEILSQPVFGRLLDAYEYNVAYNVIRGENREPQDADFEKLQEIYENLIGALRESNVDSAVIDVLESMYKEKMLIAQTGYQDKPEDALAYLNDANNVRELEAEIAAMHNTNSIPAGSFDDSDIDPTHDVEPITQNVTLENWLTDLSARAYLFAGNEEKLLQMFGDGTGSVSYRKLLSEIEMYARNEANGDNDVFLDLYNDAVEIIDNLQVDYLRPHGYFNKPKTPILTPIIPVASRDRNTTSNDPNTATISKRRGAHLTIPEQKARLNEVNAHIQSIGETLGDFTPNQTYETVQKVMGLYNREQDLYRQVNGKKSKFDETPRAEAIICVIAKLVREDPRLIDLSSPEREKKLKDIFKVLKK